MEGQVNSGAALACFDTRCKQKMARGSDSNSEKPVAAREVDNAELFSDVFRSYRR